ncbi:MAG: hypothetical protein GY757_54685 [bacterium]|nr:hypothetical protein [bacterium]
MSKVDKKNISDILALTPMQQGMLFHYLKEPEKDYYFEQLSLEITGEINTGTFEKAWNIVIKTNEALRTLFRWEKLENPLQIILKEHKLHPIYIDLSHDKTTEKKDRLEAIKKKTGKTNLTYRTFPSGLPCAKSTKTNPYII